MDAKMDVKKDEKKDAIDGVLRKCTIALGLAPDCSRQLGKNYTEIWCYSTLNPVFVVVPTYTTEFEPEI